MFGYYNDRLFPEKYTMKDHISNTKLEKGDHYYIQTRHEDLFSKAFIFQKFRRPLCLKVNLLRYETRRRHFIITCDIFGTGQTNILGLCYIFGKTAHSSSTQVTEINTLDLACVASVPNRVIVRTLERK